MPSPCLQHLLCKPPEESTAEAMETGTLNPQHPKAQNLTVPQPQNHAPLLMPRSGLWPFATVGWPDESSADYSKFYPEPALGEGFGFLGV